MTTEKDFIKKLVSYEKKLAKQFGGNPRQVVYKTFDINEERKLNLKLLVEQNLMINPDIEESDLIDELYRQLDDPQVREAIDNNIYQRSLGLEGVFTKYNPDIITLTKILLI